MYDDGGLGTLTFAVSYPLGVVFRGIYAALYAVRDGGFPGIDLLAAALGLLPYVGADWALQNGLRTRARAT